MDERRDADAATIDAGPEPSGLMGAFDELLKTPQRLLARARADEPPRAALRLALGSLVAVAAYGAAAGIFQGGDTIALAALKAPMIVALSLALCLPSLYIFAALAGAAISRRLFVLLVAGFAGMVALLLLGLLPIAWLFSVSSRSLPFVVWLHFLAWLTAACFGVRFLSRGLDGRVAIALRMWLFLFLIVSFQVATFLRPVLWRGPGEGIFASGKMSFFEQLGHVYKVRTTPPGRPAAAAEPAKPAPDR
ncbi:MAG TPA: hypothetical protein VN923_02165 [Thermoanaerobaculia bacterium]|nr:hypothetical protein [Thermoanaerobaculia bacterium]